VPRGTNRLASALLRSTKSRNQPTCQSWQSALDGLNPQVTSSKDDRRRCCIRRDRLRAARLPASELAALALLHFRGPPSPGSASRPTSSSSWCAGTCASACPTATSKSCSPNAASRSTTSLPDHSPLPGAERSAVWACPSAYRRSGVEHQTRNLALTQRRPSLTEFLTEDDRPTDGSQSNRRTESTRFCGREQHRQTTGHQTDDSRQTTDLAVGGSSPSRRAHFRR
jgi:hypothetical protein